MRKASVHLVILQPSWTKYWRRDCVVRRKSTRLLEAGLVSHYTTFKQYVTVQGDRMGSSGVTVPLSTCIFARFPVWV